LDGAPPHPGHCPRLKLHGSVERLPAGRHATRWNGLYERHLCKWHVLECWRCRRNGRFGRRGCWWCWRGRWCRWRTDPYLARFLQLWTVIGSSHFRVGARGPDAPCGTATKRAPGLARCPSTSARTSVSHGALNCPFVKMIITGTKFPLHTPPSYARRSRRTLVVPSFETRTSRQTTPRHPRQPRRFIGKTVTANPWILDDPCQVDDPRRTFLITYKIRRNHRSWVCRRASATKRT